MFNNFVFAMSTTMGDRQPNCVAADMILNENPRLNSPHEIEVAQTLVHFKCTTVKKKLGVDLTQMFVPLAEEHRLRIRLLEAEIRSKRPEYKYTFVNCPDVYYRFVVRCINTSREAHAVSLGFMKFV